MRNSSGLRICVASTGLGHVMRGAEAWASYLGRALAERGERVILCKGGGTVAAEYERVIPCWNRDSDRTRRLLRFVPNAIGWRIGFGSAYSVEQSTFAWRLLRLLRRERIDVLHLKDPQVAIIVQHAVRTGFCTTRTVLSHGTEEPAEFQQRIQYLQHLAPWHQEQAESAGIWKDSWTMIPNFIDTNRFRPGASPSLRREFSIPPHAKVVLVSSAIKSRHKRVDYLIDEFGRVRRTRPDLPIWLVIAGGRESETGELIQKAKDSLGDHVRFAVNFPSARMPELYRMADMLIHGSLKEMLGNSLLEAIATGIPCVVHDHPVMRWLIGDGGLAIDLSVAGNLAAAITGLCEDGVERDRLGAQARQQCCRLFSKDVVVDQILEYYERVVGRSQMAA